MYFILKVIILITIIILIIIIILYLVILLTKGFNWQCKITTVCNNKWLKIFYQYSEFIVLLSYFKRFGKLLFCYLKNKNNKIIFNINKVLYLQLKK